MKNRFNAKFHQISQILVLAFIISLGFISCKKTDRIDEIQQVYFFELVDSVKMNIPYDFGLIFPKITDGHLLAYSHLDQTFHVLDSMGRVQNFFKHQGEGPKEYSSNLPFVTGFKGQLIFMDEKKLTFFNYDGEWVKSVPFNDPNVSGRGGMPYSDLSFLNHDTFIVPNVHVGGISRMPDHQAILDTIPFWIQYEYSNLTNQFEQTEFGLLDTSSVFNSNLKFMSYVPSTFVEKGYVYLFFPLFPTIYKYEIGKSAFPIENRIFDFPGFKNPIGLEFESISIDNYQEFNRASEINSILSYVVSLEDERLFMIYGTGKDISMNDSEADAKEAPESLFFGYVNDNTNGIGSRIDLPKHHGHPSFGQKVTYLGKNRFLFVFENEVENDFYWGKIFELKPIINK